MIERGIVDEVRNLLARGYEGKARALHSLGYKHIISYIRGHLPLEEALRLIQRDTEKFRKEADHLVQERKRTSNGSVHGTKSPILARVRAF